MKQTTTQHLDKANNLATRARAMIEGGWYEDGGRCAYLAGFHAAHAFIFERAGKVPKTHNGLQTMFHLLIRDDPAFNDQDRRFLNLGYNLKSEADYETGPDALVSAEDASDATAMAERLLVKITALLANPPTSIQSEDETQ